MFGMVDVNKKKKNFLRNHVGKESHESCDVSVKLKRFGSLLPLWQVVIE